MDKIRCRNQQNRNDHYCRWCGRQMKHGEEYWRDTNAEITCDDCQAAGEAAAATEEGKRLGAIVEAASRIPDDPTRGLFDN